MQSNRSQEAEALLRYLSNYTGDPTIQEAEAAASDPQIRNLSLKLAEIVDSHSTGTVLDIGCGKGVILQRLAEIDTFKNSSDWIYIGSDYEDQLSEIKDIAWDQGLHRRVEILYLDELYNDWVSEISPPSPIVVVIRNVFHELSIEKTSQLIHLVCDKTTHEDRLLVQDLQVFPQAERLNVCWPLDRFEALLEQCGIDCISTGEISRSGNRWFTILGRKRDEFSSSKYQVKQRVIDERVNQFEIWSNAGELIDDDFDERLEELAQIDFDLQLLALHVRLREADVLDIEPSTEQQAKAVRTIFRRNIEGFDVDQFVDSIVPVSRPSHFRNRANSQDALENFLIEDETIAVIQGGPHMGKSDLVREVLHHRAHEREAVMLDVQTTSGVWSLVEQYITSIGCSLEYDVIRGLRDVKFEHIRDSFSDLVNTVSEHTVVVFDHFERLLTPSFKVADTGIREFITCLSTPPSAKVIITTRKNPLFSFLPDAIAVNKSQPPVYRFPKSDGQHVTNVLNDFVGEFGRSEYPNKLHQAIDRVPNLAVLAGRIIKQEGPSVLDDERFLKDLRDRLRKRLLKRIVTDDVEPKINVLSLLRIPVPQAMVEALIGKTDTEKIRRMGLLYQIDDRSQLSPLLSLVNTLKDVAYDKPLGEFKEEIVDTSRDEDHKRIADLYDRFYSIDHDPRWIRERYYHVLSSGDSELVKHFGTVYKTELFNAGQYWFEQKRDYSAALEAFKAAVDLSHKTYKARMRLASCMVRVGQVDAGKQKYYKLIDDYPDKWGPKTSLVDSLLFINNYEEALDVLDEFGLNMSASHWVAGQYGRAYMGLNNYKKAIDAFERSKKLEKDHFTFRKLATAYSCLGRLEDVERTLKEGISACDRTKKLKLYYARHLIQKGYENSISEAENILTELNREYPQNGEILQQLAKLLCIRGRPNDAHELVENIGLSNIHPEWYVTPIMVEIKMEKGKWREATDRIGSLSGKDRHLVGLKKKVYLQWARNTDEPQRKRSIAQDGLDVPVKEELFSNIPILVVSAKLARFADRQDLFDGFIDKIQRLNPNVAEEMHEIDSPHYWEDIWEEDL
jgi:tetratricopeptide (TPR) repeat protein